MYNRIMLFLKLTLIVTLFGLTYSLTQLRENDITQGCNECALSGNCERAYRNSSGQMCLFLQNNVPCCCPFDSQCVMDRTDTCLCTRKKSDKITTFDIFMGFLLFITLSFLLIPLLIDICYPIYRRYYGYEVYDRFYNRGMFINSGSAQNYGSATFSGNVGTTLI